MSAASEKPRRKTNLVAQGDCKFAPWGWPQNPSKRKKANIKNTLPSRRIFVPVKLSNRHDLKLDLNEFFFHDIMKQQ